MDKVFECLFVSPCLCTLPQPVNELHAILKDAKLVCERGHAWSTTADWPTKGTMGNKWTGHAIATQISGYCFPYSTYPSLTPPCVNFPLDYKPSTGDTYTTRGDGGPIDHITVVMWVTIHNICQTLGVFQIATGWGAEHQQKSAGHICKYIQSAFVPINLPFIVVSHSNRDKHSKPQDKFAK